MIIFNAISFYLRWRFVNKLLTDVCRGKRINIISTAQKWDNNFSEQQIHLAKTVRTVWSAGSAFLSFFFFLRFTIDIPMQRDRDMRVALRFESGMGIDVEHLRQVTRIDFFFQAYRVAWGRLLWCFRQQVSHQSAGGNSPACTDQELRNHGKNPVTFSRV